ncbi:MAG: hypothetical protein AAB897_00115 [Patescibacteria group bacterium]
MVTQSLPLDIPAEMAQGWIGNKEAVDNFLRAFLLAEKPRAGNSSRPSEPLSLVQWKSKFRGWPCNGCGKPLSGEIGFYPSQDGFEIKSFLKKQEIFAICPCGTKTEPDIGVGYRETAETFNPEFTVVVAAFKKVLPLLGKNDPRQPAWFDGVKRSLEKFRGEFDGSSFVCDPGSCGGEAFGYELGHLSSILHNIKDEDIPEAYHPFRKFRHAFLAWYYN